MAKTTSKTPYVEAYQKGKSLYEKGATTQKNYLKDSYKQQVAGINSDYDRTANQAYVQYRQNEKAQEARYGRGFYKCAFIRYAANGRNGNRHRPHGNAADKSVVHP